MARANKDQKLYDALVDLKRHLRSCAQCQAARKSVTPHFMCQAGLLLTLRAAEGYDDVIRLRLKAHNKLTGCVFACPDLMAHGKAFALTAPALHVVAVQDEMF